PGKVVRNVAVTDRAAVIGTVQSAVVPAHAPLQPENVAPAAVKAVSVTVVPGTNAAAHVAPQPIPAGLLLTLPGPTVETDSTRPWRTKVAVTVVSPPSVTAQVPAPEQPPPLPPAKPRPAAGGARSVTTAPAPKVCEHTLPQSIPAGADAPVPVPAPVRATVTRNDWLVSTIRWSVPLLPDP